MFRKHGDQKIIVLHGGPGAIGSVHSLSKYLGGIEILNYGQTIEEQITEIDEAIDDIKNTIIVGHSWGAWLAYIYASQRPVKKVILIGCGAFDEKYLNHMMETRMAKLTEKEQQRAHMYFDYFNQGKAPEGLNDFNHLMSKMDSYHLIASEKLKSFDIEGHAKLMTEIRELRKTYELLDFGKNINGEIVIMHGHQDPHPIKGVTEPLTSIGVSYKLYTYNQCGHLPWLEKFVKEKFLVDIKNETSYFFTTERLGFRYFTMEDSESFFEMNCNSKVMAYFPKQLTKEGSDQFLSRIIERYKKGYGLYAVDLLENGEFIGFIGLSSPSFEIDFTPCIEIGWRIKDKFWHKGYATEGALAVIRYAKTVNIDEIVSFTALLNKPSIAVMKRIGMKYDKDFDHPSVEGPLKTHVLYRLGVNEL